MDGRVKMARMGVGLEPFYLASFISGTEKMENLESRVKTEEMAKAVGTEERVEPLPSISRIAQNLPQWLLMLAVAPEEWLGERV
jgi:hypothetical protein